MPYDSARGIFSVHKYLSVLIILERLYSLFRLPGTIDLSVTSFGILESDYVTPMAPMSFELRIDVRIVHFPILMIYITFIIL